MIHQGDTAAAAHTDAAVARTKAGKVRNRMDTCSVGAGGG